MIEADMLLYPAEALTVKDRAFCIINQTWGGIHYLLDKFLMEILAQNIGHSGPLMVKDTCHFSFCMCVFVCLFMHIF